MRRPTVEISEEEMMLLLQGDLDRANTVEAWAECVADWVFSSLDSTTSRDLSQIVTVYSQLEEEEKPQFLTALLRATTAAFASCRDAKEKMMHTRLFLSELKAHMELWERLTVEEVPEELTELSHEIYAFAGELGDEYAAADLDLASLNVLIQYGEPDREFLLRALKGRCAQRVFALLLEREGIEVVGQHFAGLVHNVLSHGIRRRGPELLRTELARLNDRFAAQELIPLLRAALDGLSDSEKRVLIKEAKSYKLDLE